MFSETSVDTQQTTWRYIPEDDTLPKYKQECDCSDRLQQACLTASVVLILSSVI
jgi:hypothetical protein